MSATPTRAVIYARISSDRTGRAAGVRRQERECRELAERRGWTVLDVLVDNDTSAVASRRPGWDTMLTGIRDGRYDAVVAWHPDRMMRSLKGLADLLAVVQAHDTTIATVNAGDVDLSTASGRLQASIVTAVAAHEREHTGERVKASQDDRRREGKPLGRRAWGWTEDRMTADPRLAEALATAARGLVDGRSLRTMADELARAKVPAPSGGDGWDADALRAVLRRPANVSRYRDGSAGGWEPLLDEELAARVAAALSDPGRRSTETTVRTRLLGGVLRCATHGDPMYARWQRHRARWVYTPRGTQCTTAPVVETDALVTDVLLAYLEREAVTVPTPGDGGLAAAELAEAHRAAEALDAELAAGRLRSDRWQSLNAQVSARVERAQAVVDAHRSGTLLAGMTGPGVRGIWPTLPVQRQTAIVAALLSVTVSPGRRGQRGFDASRINITPRNP